MLCETLEHALKEVPNLVLILVLMEYALRVLGQGHRYGDLRVLILVLMEYALRVRFKR